jgi:zinc transporter 1
MKPEIKYTILIILVGIFFLIELGVGIYTKSLSLQTDAFHMLSDLIALIIGLTCDILSKERRRTNYTYGWIRAEIIGGLINSVFLLALSFSIFIDLIEQTIDLSTNDLQNPMLMQEIDMVLIVAGVGLFINIVGLGLFHDHHHHNHDTHPDPTDQIIHHDPNQISIPMPQVINHNHHGVWLHVLGDALGSIVVIISGLLIKYLESPYRFIMDPIASLLIVIAIAWHSWKLLKRTILILIHKNPHDELQIMQEIKKLDGIKEIHEFHIWSLTSTINIASIHVRLCDDCWNNSTDEIIKEINQIFHRHGIHSSTIQPEFTSKCIEFLCENDCKTLQCC